MLFLTWNPRPPLSKCVDFMWLYEGEAPAHAEERILPTGAVDMVISLVDGAFESPILTGVHTRYFIIGASIQCSTMGVVFKPGGAVPVLGVPASAIANAHVPLAELWGGEARALQDRIVGAPSSRARFRILEDALIARLPRAAPVHSSVEAAVRWFGSAAPPSVAGAAAQAGLSHRRFIEVFRQAVGAAPKAYCRVRRFQRALARIHGPGDRDWMDVALDCGYYDQAHFIHDFRAFSGVSPTAYAALCDGKRNHVPVLD